MEYDKCAFKQEYYDFKTGKEEIFHCEIEHEENKKFCVFHDETYLKNIKHPENKDNVITKLYSRIEDSISHNTPLLCIGYYLPDIKINREFKQPIYFNHSKFQNVNFSDATFSSGADFSDATFSSEANFHEIKFSSGADFSDATFSDSAYFSGRFEDITYFNYVIFYAPDKVIFEVEDMSNVSFIYTDITRLKFSNMAIWNNDRGICMWSKESYFKVIEEKWLEETLDKPIGEMRRPTLGDVLSVYKKLRANYELRGQYYGADKFFIREKELNRKYTGIKPT